MKKILVFVNHGDIRGGANRSFLDLLPMLCIKYEIYLVAPNLENDFITVFKKYCKNKYLCLDKLCKTGVHKKEINSIRNRVKRLCYPFRVKILINKIDKYFNIKFDLVYSNSICVQVGAEFAKFKKIPHIWHVREFMEEDHGLDFYNRKHIYNDLFAYSNAIFITNAISDKFKQYFKSKTMVIHNFVKFDYVKKHSNDYFVFAIVGNISESKGQRYAIVAFNTLLNKYPNCKLLIVGVGGDIDYCKKLVAEYDIEDKVEFLGQRNDVNQILSNVNVQLVCSRFEAMGRVTVEGMLSKTLVIGADTAGTKELIGDNYGLLYKQGNTQDLCDKMIYSIEHKTECEKIVEDAYNYAIKEFSYENYESKLINFFESVLNYNEFKK